MRFLIAALSFVVGIVAVACRGDGSTSGATTVVPRSVAACGASRELFTVSPVPVSEITGWVPLGNLNPPGHTFPTDHQYIYVRTQPAGAAPFPLVAPGKMTVVSAKMTRYSTGTTYEDYALSFSPCADVLGEFGHVTTLDAGLKAKIGPFDQRCQSYEPSPGMQVSQCYSKPTDIVLEAGERIGGTRGLDLSLFDRRVAPLAFANATRWTSNSSGFDHFHVVAFSEYFAEPARSTVQALLGSFDGRTRRVALPLGGTIATDVAGTAQGTWFLPGHETYPESPHLAVVPDNVDPTRVTFSTGGTIPGLIAGAYVFAPVGAGIENRDPATITPSATIYCWAIGYSDTDRRGIVLVQLPDVNTLRVEARPATTCAANAPYTFGTSAATYIR